MLGILVLEAQGFSNYGKRKKLSDAIYDNYKNIKMRPENFPDFLLHDVGFARCDVSTEEKREDKKCRK